MQTKENTIGIFDAESGEYVKNGNADNLFRGTEPLPEDLRTAFDEETESFDARPVLEKIIRTEGRIVLNRSEILSLKRRLLLETLRGPGCIGLGAECRKSYPEFPASRRKKEYAADIGSRESDRGYWERTLGCIIGLHESHVPLDVYEHPESTFFAYRYAFLFSVGGFAIWEAPDGYGFVIPDRKMIPETDGTDRKTECIRKIRGNPDIPKQLETELCRVSPFVPLFRENFFLFPLSENRILALVNPFFGLYDERLGAGKHLPPLDHYTELDSPGLFVCGRDIHPDGTCLCFEREYEPAVLSPEQTVCCNKLLMDGTVAKLGIPSMEKAYQSILEYQKMPYARTDFGKLFETARGYARNP